MQDTQLLAERFDADRPRLRGVALRMLGSPAEAEDAVQEVWLRISRSDLAQVENLSGWMTTVTGRVCLDLLRSRRARREEGFEGRPQETWALDRYAPDPEAEALLGESVGLALLTVLEKLTPPERVAFVLHDMFGAPSRRSPPSSVEVLRRPGSWPAGRAAGSGAAPLGPVQI